jgi:hypothetical protein
MTNYPLMFGQLNDGREAQFPVSDVKAVDGTVSGSSVLRAH